MIFVHRTAKHTLTSRSIQSSSCWQTLALTGSLVRHTCTLFPMYAFVVDTLSSCICVVPSCASCVDMSVTVFWLAAVARILLLFVSTGTLGWLVVGLFIVAMLLAKLRNEGSCCNACQNCNACLQFQGYVKRHKHIYVNYSMYTNSVNLFLSVSRYTSMHARSQVHADESST